MGKKIPMPDRFWSRIVKGARPSDCWDWTGNKDADGYGFLGLAGQRGRSTRAHRYSWELHNVMPIPAGACICHRCDNPSCCNPGHLFLGTRAVNNADMIAKDRHNRGSRNGLAKLSEADIPIIREMATAGIPQRRIAAHVGVTENAIRCVLNGRTWRHVDSSPERFDRFPLGQLDGAAVQNGGPVSFQFDEGSGVVPVVRHRDRPGLFLVSSK